MARKKKVAEPVVEETPAEPLPDGRVGQWYWHVHHEELAEVLTDPIEDRIEWITTGKPAHERETRLRLMTPIRGTVPAALVAAWEAYFAANAAADAAWQHVFTTYPYPEHYFETKEYAAYRTLQNAAHDAHDAAWDALNAAQSELEALHKTEHPDCPWDGNTIFPR